MWSVYCENYMYMSQEINIVAPFMLYAKCWDSLQRSYYGINDLAA